MGRNHIAALDRVPGVRLCAVADPAFEQVPHLLAVDDSIATFTDASEMLAEAQPQSVHIVSPPQTHFPIAMAAVAAGSHIYVEKPFCTELDDAKKLFEAADNAGVMVCAGHQLTHHPTARKFWPRLPSLGNAVHVEAGFYFQSVRRDAAGALMRAHDQLMDVLPHPVYLTLYALRKSVGDSERMELSVVSSPEAGEIRAIGRYGTSTFSLVISLRGRPVDTYIKVVGNRGSAHADLVLGSIRRQIAPRKSAPTVLLRPFSMALQETFGTAYSLGQAAFSKRARSGGLEELFRAFYSTIASGSGGPANSADILETVRICGEIEETAIDSLMRIEDEATEMLREREAGLPPVTNEDRVIAVTGASGFLGKRVIKRLRHSGFNVRGIVRRLPLASERCAGIDYVEADLGRPLSQTVLKDVETVVHLAAETAGGKELHERNTINATINLLTACSEAGVGSLINISSIAVVGSGAAEPISETSPLDDDPEVRGPYVWGKARAEAEAVRLTKKSDISIVTIRPGPLVDFDHFEPPGRIGRSIGSLLIAVGPRNGKLPVCDVETMARLIELYVRDIAAGPNLVHALEPDAQTRAELVQKVKDQFPGTKAIWLPRWLLQVLSKTVSVLMRILGKKPLDIYGAFRSIEYDTSTVRSVFAGQPVRPDSAEQQ